MPEANTLQVIVAIAVFGLVLALWVLALLGWSLVKARQAQRIEQRLGLGPSGQPLKGRHLRLWHDGQEATTLVPEGMHRFSPIYQLDRLRQDAGVEIPASTLLLLGLGVTLMLALTVYTLTSGSWLLALVSMLVVPIGGHIILSERAAKRLADMDRQLVDGMLLASRSLRAGHPLIAAFRLISEEIPAPLGTLFGKICQQQQLGVGLEDAVRQAADESGHDDLKLFATSVMIQLRSGGNLADTIDRLASVVNDRIRLSRRVRVLTAQTQLSKRMLLALPIVMFVLLGTTKPDYMRVLYTTDKGRLLLGMAGAGMALGAWVMSRMAKIQY